MDQPASHQRQFVRDTSGKVRTFAGLAFCLVIPSCGVIQKYFGNIGLLIYLVAATAILWLVFRYLLELVLSRLSERQAQFLAAVTFVALIAVFALVFPRATVHVAGRGSHADDALNLAVGELLHGRYPYYVQTYLQNAIANFPGAILLAAPFVLLGNSAYQNLFWFGVFFFAVSRLQQSWRGGLILIWIVLLFSPVVINYVVTGGDDLANSIYVLLFMLLTVRWVSSSDVPAWKRVLAALLVGVGLSSRANFLLVMPQLFAALTIKAGWRCFRGGDDSVLALRPGGFYAAARSSAQSSRVSNHPAVCRTGRAGVGRLHRDGSGVAEHQAPARDVAQRLCDRAGVPGRLRGHAYDNSDGNAFAHLDQLRSFLLVFWRARLWTEDV